MEPYELGGPGFDIAELARVISEVTGTLVTYRNLPVDEYACWLQQTGLDAEIAAALDASIAHGDRQPGLGGAARPSCHAPR